MQPWLDLSEKRSNLQYEQVGLTAGDAVELASAFRLYGFWRMDLDTGHVFATEDFCRIFSLEICTGPINLVAVNSRIHPDDRQMLMETFERASVAKLTYHNIYRVKANAEDYKYVRSVGRFREKPGTSGEVVGLIYEFFAQRTGVSFFLDDPNA